MDKAPETSSGFSRRRFVQGVGTLSLGVATTTVPLHATASEATGEKDQHYFLHAHPIWPNGVELEKNILVGFRAVVDGPLDGAVVLRIAASTIYRLFRKWRVLRLWSGARGALTLSSRRVGYWRTYPTGKERGCDRGRRLQRQQLLRTRSAIISSS
jgi:hypothetical protein